MALLNDTKVASPWNLEDSDTRRSERMVRSLTERIPHDTTLVEISRTHAYAGYPETEQYVRRLDVAHISQAGWVDLYTGQVNDNGRDAFRHVSLSGFDMEKLLTVYLAEHSDVLSRVLANMGLLLADQSPRGPEYRPDNALDFDTLMFYGVQFQVGDVLVDGNGATLRIDALYETQGEGGNRYANVTTHLIPGGLSQRTDLVGLQGLAKQIISRELVWQDEDTRTVCRNCKQDVGREQIGDAQICTQCWRDVPLSTLQRYHGAEDFVWQKMDKDYAKGYPHCDCDECRVSAGIPVMEKPTPDHECAECHRILDKDELCICTTCSELIVGVARELSQ